MINLNSDEHDKRFYASRVCKILLAKTSIEIDLKCVLLNFIFFIKLPIPFLRVPLLIFGCRPKAQIHKPTFMYFHYKKKSVETSSPNYLSIFLNKILNNNQEPPQNISNNIRWTSTQHLKTTSPTQLFLFNSSLIFSQITHNSALFFFLLIPPQNRTPFVDSIKINLRPRSLSHYRLELRQYAITSSSSCVCVRLHNNNTTRLILLLSKCHFQEWKSFRMNGSSKMSVIIQLRNGKVDKIIICMQTVFSSRFDCSAMKRACKIHRQIYDDDNWLTVCDSTTSNHQAAINNSQFTEQRTTELNCQASRRWNWESSPGDSSTILFQYIYKELAIRPVWNSFVFNAYRWGVWMPF